MLGKAKGASRAAAALAGLLALLAGPLAAQSAIFSPLPFGEQVDGNLLRMLREVFPDLVADGKATRYAGVPAVPDAVDDDTGKPAVGRFDLAADRARAPVQAVLKDGAASYAVVPVADIVIVARTAPDYVYGGALFVRTDPGGPASIRSVFLAAPGVVMVLVTNAHHNSQEAFTDYLLIGPMDGKLAPLFAGPSLYSSSGSDATCDDRAMTQRLEALQPLAPRRHGYPNLSLRVVEESECRSPGKIAAAPPRQLATVLRWDAAMKKYVGDLRAFDELSKRPP